MALRPNPQYVGTYNEGKRVKVKVNSNRAVNDGDIVRRWCVDGEGIAKKSCIDVAGDYCWAAAYLTGYRTAN